MNPLKQKYQDSKQDLMSKLGYDNINEIPKLEKITVNMGIGGLIQKTKSKTPLEALQKDLAVICCQKPILTKARKSVASFHIRHKQDIGLKVTLRRSKMYDFFYKVVSIVLPRIRDFRGFPSKQLDNTGNFTFSIPEQTIFPEIDASKVTIQNGMDIILTVKCKKPSDTIALLKVFDFPLRDIQ